MHLPRPSLAGTRRRQRRRPGAAMVSLGVAVAAASIFSVSYAATPDDRPAGQLVADEDGRWSVVGGAPDDPLTAGTPGRPISAARHAVEEIATGLRIANPGTELRPTSTRRMDDGGHTIRFSQTVAGIPVFGSGVAVRLSADNAALSVSSSAIATERTGDTDLIPSVDAEAAADTARRASTRDVARLEAVTTSTPELVLYDPELIGGDPNAETISSVRLAWSVLVATADGSYRQRVLVDASDGAALLSFSEVPDALNRNVCDYHNSSTAVVCRAEGAPAAAGYDELNHAYDFVGQSYQYLADEFGRDGYDDAGSAVEAHTRVCPSFSPSCPYWNAYWYGSGMVLGQGFANADDIVAHEYAHGLTQYEANLMYYAESGAINESMSDIFGEFTDQSYDTLGTDTPTNAWLLGEDFTTIRSMSHPRLYGHPDRVLSPDYHLAASDNYGVHMNSGIGNKAAYLITEGGAFNGRTVTGIGRTKAAAIYYEALTALLTPGSDYLDLFGILPQACTNLVGTKGITNADCIEVGDAVAATEMNRVVSQRRTTTKVCAQGSRTVAFSDNAEAGLGKWVTLSGSTGWSSTTRASQSGTRSLRGPSPAGTDQNGPGFSSWLRTRYRVTIPATGDSYLWFDHSFNLEETWDGGVVEFSTNGSTWTDLGSQIEANGYTGLLDVSANPITGRRAFTGMSRGFQQTRVSLAGLAGQSVYLRFFIGADATFAADGWFVDDVEVYTCTTSPETTTTTSTPTTTSTTTTTTAPPTPTPTFGSGYQPITPRRLVDTRSSVGLVAARGKRSARSVLRFNARTLGIYNGGHTPTALNLTITSVGNSAPGHVTAYPCGTRPATSTLNATETNSIAVNTATIPISATGEICIYTHAHTHLLVDVAGYQTSTRGGTPPSRYQPLAPRRVVDTRNGSGLIAVKGRRSARSTLVLDVSNLGIFKNDTNQRALDLTFTAVNNGGLGHLTAYPCGNRPNTSLLNTYKPRQVVSNTATVPVSSSGKVCVYNATATDLIVDITGYYSDTEGPRLAKYRPLTPKRVVDTRNSTGLYKVTGVRRAGSILRINMNSLGLHKSGHNPTAFDLTFTMILNEAPGHITAYPCGSRPTASVINASTSKMVIANTATIPVAANGDICVYTHPRTHLAIDVTGYHYT